MLPQHLPPHSSGGRREPHATCRRVSSARRGCFSPAWQDPAALPGALLTRLTLSPQRSSRRSALTLQEPLQQSCPLQFLQGRRLTPQTSTETGWCQSRPSHGRGGLVPQGIGLQLHLFILRVPCSRQIQRQQAGQAAVSVLGPNRRSGHRTLQPSVCKETALTTRGSTKSTGKELRC